MRFLLTADWHVQGERPLCRRDTDWIGTQRQAIRFVVDLANSRGLPLVVIGDICNTPRISTPALVMLIEELKRALSVWLVAGNHDLPFHSYKNVADCSFGVLRQLFPELGPDSHPFGSDLIGASPFGLDADGIGRWAQFTHQLVFPDEASRPAPAVGKTAAELADQFPNAAWIFTGDYHHAFVRDVLPARLEGMQDGDVEADLVHVVNPGCLLRHAADMLDYQPRVAIVDTDAGTVEWVDVPDPGILTDGEAVVTDSYLREAEARDEKVEAFIECIRTSGTVSLSFRDNLARALLSPDIPSGVHEIIHEMQNTLNKEK